MASNYLKPPHREEQRPSDLSGVYTAPISDDYLARLKREALHAHLDKQMEDELRRLMIDAPRAISDVSELPDVSWSNFLSRESERQRLSHAYAVRTERLGFWLGWLLGFPSGMLLTVILVGLWWVLG